MNQRLNQFSDQPGKDPLAPRSQLHGRGTALQPVNRFEKIAWEPDPEVPPEEQPLAHTEFFVDTSRSLITHNDSPDVGFSAGINVYRGCEHGCIYCYARPYHEYLGLSSGLDFETKIFVKKEAPELLRRELSRPAWKPQVLGMSGVTDCYQPAERTFQLTRRCLEVLAEFRNPVGIITKNRLITRDIDVLQELARHQAVSVCVTVTSLDAELSGKLEPRASRPAYRLRAIEELSKAGIPVAVLVAPIIPGLTEHEIPRIVTACANAGARSAGYTIVRLPYALKEMFSQWLADHFPDRKQKVLNRLRSLREGKLYHAEFGKRMHGEGVFADQIADLFNVACKKAGMNEQWSRLSTANFRRPSGTQMVLFE